MKNKIQKFSKGDFQLIRPDVIFDETNLVLIIGEGEVYRGSFTMRANNEGRIRGLVYSSSFRVHFKDQGFEVLEHQLVPPNDGGIALGQAVYAMEYLEKNKGRL